MKIGMVSLGCAKNTVNSEQMLWLLNEAGYEISGDLADVDIIIVNTCAFIESAKSEAIENILEFAELKKEGRLKKIIVAGCLPQRYREDIKAELPEVDAMVGCGSFGAIVEAVRAVEAGLKPELFGDINSPCEETDRVVTSGDGWAYLKIAEGCDNHCAFCVIPSIRGKYRSRPIDGIVREARDLAGLGVVELILVAQDVTAYGTDFGGKRMLPELLRALSETDGIERIRLHYLYPDEIDDALIREMASNPKIVKYVDIPIQHINDAILERMNRRGSGGEIRELIKKLRREIPGVVIRSTLITGLPGEGEAEFEELMAFLREARMERVGVFAFSPEEGTPAAEMPDIPPREVAERRAELVSELQAEIMDEFNASRVGKTLRVLCEGYDRFAECWFGRSEADSPDVDGKVFFTGPAAPGKLVDVRITETLDGELLGEAAK
ncbi:MAG: 30S ribosomal protein S12 methylthiotransferase RimO [Oscillospiraceae bacterium]|nr:30S ribosomal protein S12 methylthiotransferase RimO [Oscillospiraceae bacterium]